MTHIIDIHSYKGGTGVTTTACAVAMASARAGKTTLLIDAQDTPNSFSFFGMSEPVKGDNSIKNVGLDITANLDLITDEGSGHVSLDNYEVVVFDNGRQTGINYEAMGYPVSRVCVVRNDYMTLRNTVARSATPSAPEVEAFVLFYDATVTLSDRDVTAVLGTDAIVVKMDAHVQRTIDAGLTTTRRVFDWAEEVVATLTPETA